MCVDRVVVMFVVVGSMITCVGCVVICGSGRVSLSLYKLEI